MRKPADEEIVALLISGGVDARGSRHIPAEALEDHAGGAISYDELLDFALWLDRLDLLASLITPRVQADPARGHPGGLPGVATPGAWYQLWHLLDARRGRRDPLLDGPRRRASQRRGR